MLLLRLSLPFFSAVLIFVALVAAADDDDDVPWLNCDTLKEDLRWKMVRFARSMEIGDALTVTGTVYASANMSYINFYEGFTNTFGNGPVSIHIREQYIPRTTIYNSWLNGRWGPEEFTATPYYRNTPYTITILRNPNTYAVYQGSNLIKVYGYRNSPSAPIGNVISYGDWSVDSMTMHCVRAAEPTTAGPTTKPAPTTPTTPPTTTVVPTTTPTTPSPSTPVNPIASDPEKVPNGGGDLVIEKTTKKPVTAVEDDIEVPGTSSGGSSGGGGTGGNGGNGGGGTGGQGGKGGLGGHGGGAGGNGGNGGNGPNGNNGNNGNWGNWGQNGTAGGWYPPYPPYPYPYPSGYQYPPGYYPYPPNGYPPNGYPQGGNGGGQPNIIIINKGDEDGNGRRGRGGKGTVSGRDPSFNIDDDEECECEEEDDD